MRTANTPQEIGSHPLVLTDATGATYQHVASQDFLMPNTDDDTETRYHRDDQWWTIRADQVIDPRIIVFPVTIVFES